MNFGFCLGGGVPCGLCIAQSVEGSMQGRFAVSALWVLWPLLWILDLAMHLFSFFRMMVSLDLSAGFFLLSCWRGVWEQVARHVTCVMTFCSWRHTGAVYWQRAPAVDASVLAKLCVLLIDLVGAEGKKQYLQESGLGGGVVCVTAVLVDTQSGGPMLAVGFTPSHFSVHSHACEVSCVHVAGMSSAAFISALGNLIRRSLSTG